MRNRLFTAPSRFSYSSLTRLSVETDGNLAVGGDVTAIANADITIASLNFSGGTSATGAGNANASFTEIANDKGSAENFDPANVDVGAAADATVDLVADGDITIDGSIAVAAGAAADAFASAIASFLNPASANVSAVAVADLDIAAGDITSGTNARSITIGGGVSVIADADLSGAAVANIGTGTSATAFAVAGAIAGAALNADADISLGGGITVRGSAANSASASAPSSSASVTLAGALLSVGDGVFLLDGINLGTVDFSATSAAALLFGLSSSVGVTPDSISIGGKTLVVADAGLGAGGTGSADFVAAAALANAVFVADRDVTLGGVTVLADAAMNASGLFLDGVSVAVAVANLDAHAGESSSAANLTITGGIDVEATADVDIAGAGTGTGVAVAGAFADLSAPRDVIVNRSINVSQTATYNGGSVGNGGFALAVGSGFLVPSGKLLTIQAGSSEGSSGDIAIGGGITLNGDALSSVASGLAGAEARASGSLTAAGNVTVAGDISVFGNALANSFADGSAVATATAAMFINAGTHGSGDLRIGSIGNPSDVDVVARAETVGSNAGLAFASGFLDVEATGDIEIISGLGQTLAVAGIAESEGSNAIAIATMNIGGSSANNVSANNVSIIGDIGVLAGALAPGERDGHR